ncbi:hypothetical protein KDK_58430 [Dictyobacter kobayashii]|uniref:Uncharacterized protein n=1 Tax=Dictyobacter kobayashii TaxID=2014872 RepID=A0A402ASM0_9CHLR|nr:hypothetical protein KDK_58430 [Dictyobacter kobayashii]
MNKAIRLFQRGTDLTKGGEIFLFDFVQRFRIVYKQPNGSRGRKLLEPMEVGRNRYLGLLENFKIAVESPF